MEVSGVSGETASVSQPLAVAGAALLTAGLGSAGALLVGIAGAPDHGTLTVGLSIAALGFLATGVGWIRRARRLASLERAGMFASPTPIG